jgi:protein-L-isoaspartate(D-aspartate) O-methyltransferase
LGAYKDRGLISQTIYEVMLKVDRKNFVVEEGFHGPYADMPRPIGWGTTISAPSVHATTLEKLKEFLKPGARVVDIGTGSGYIAACFAELVGKEGKVYMVDHLQQVLDFATSNIKKGNIQLFKQKRIIPVLKDGRKGLEEYAPFDIIHIGGAVSIIPPEIFAQLAPGGAIWAPVGPRD